MTSSSIPPSLLLAGKIRLLQRIGRGGMGDVWVARNEATQAEVAVKTLLKGERTPQHDERFRREARLAATVSHRNVVRVFDLIDEPDGTLGLVMELLRGITLENCVRVRGPLSTLQSLAVALSILAALEHVHQKGTVHHDVKPANIFLAVEPDGHVIPKILDFGIAKLPGSEAGRAVDRRVLGTPHYMAPEQIRGATDVDGRSDMFSMAAVLYELITGVSPFHRGSAPASLAAVLEYEVEADPRIESRVWSVLSRALAKHPEARFATCAEFAAALRASVDVGEEAFSLALEELCPLHEVSADTDGGLAASCSPHEQPSGNAEARRHRTYIFWGIGALGVGAALVGALTLGGHRSQPSFAPKEPAHSGMPLDQGAAPVPIAVSAAAPAPYPSPSALAASSGAPPLRTLRKSPSKSAPSASPASPTNGSR